MCLLLLLFKKECSCESLWWFLADPASHTIHITSEPDWDMFHASIYIFFCSLYTLSCTMLICLLFPCHQIIYPLARYHAVARAVSGCAIYVSSKIIEQCGMLIFYHVLNSLMLTLWCSSEKLLWCYSDKPGNDDFSLLKYDGSILRRISP